MRLRTVVKLGTIISVALFCLAIGYYAFMQLDTAGRNREVNLFSLIPQTSVSVLDSDNINAFLHEIPMLQTIYFFHVHILDLHQISRG